MACIAIYILILYLCCTILEANHKCRHKAIANFSLFQLFNMTELIIVPGGNRICEPASSLRKLSSSKKQSAALHRLPWPVSAIISHAWRPSMTMHAGWSVCPVPAVSWETTLQTVTDADTMQTVYRTVVIRVSLCVCVCSLSGVCPSGGVYRDR